MSAPREQWDRLARTAEQAARELEGAHPLDVLRWASDTFGDGLCVSSSMTDAVLAHLAGRARPGVPVYFLDTGYHFAETIGTRDAVAATLPVDVRTVQPLWTVAEQDADLLPRLHDRDPDRCCWLRKVEPLGPGAGAVLRLGERGAPGRVADPGGHAGGELGRAAGDRQGAPAGLLDPGRRGRVHRGARRARQPARVTTATRRSAASRARRGSSRARTPAPAAGPARAKTECGIHV